MEVMLAPTSSPGTVNSNGQDVDKYSTNTQIPVDKYNTNTQIPVNDSPWETKISRSHAVGTSGHLSISPTVAGNCPPPTTRVTSNGGLDRIPKELGTRQIASPTVSRRIGSPRAMPLLSVASLSASFHTDTTMSRFPKLFLLNFFLFKPFIFICSTSLDSLTPL